MFIVTSATVRVKARQVEDWEEGEYRFNELNAEPAGRLCPFIR